MQALRYFPLQGSFFTKPNNKALVVSLLTLWYRPRYFKCHQSHTSYCCQPQIPATFYLLIPFLWYFILVVVYEKRREFFISWAIWTCKFVCLPGITLEKDWKTWLPACNFAWFWGVCYSARSCCLGRSFVAWHFYSGLVFEVFRCDKDFAGTWSSTFGAWRIVFLQFSILSKNQGLFHRKRKDDICNWAQKKYSQY